jgi:3-oxo-5-alpha-steroid 4-dehydrogenase 3
LLDYLAGLRVPHSYFTHFYVVSVVSSLVWGLAGGPFLQSSGMTRAVQIAWLLMLLQGVRRVLESYAYTSTSKSPMWFGHWILGLLFYLTINVAIWIEGPFNSAEAVTSGQNEAFSWKLVALPPAILVCHGLQHSYHAYLYRLRTTHTTYPLPSHPLFPNLLCPHYTCEVLIYLLLSFLTAPAGQSVNSTLLCATIFVVVNLGVTAAGTKEWYERQFGVGKVRGRKRMVPWLW